MQFLGKPWKMRESIDILNLSQQKGEEAIWCENRVIILQSFSQKICQQQKLKKKTEALMNKPFYLGISILELIKTLMSFGMIT